MACKARRQGDEMYCPLCLKTWDADDPEPPLCPEKSKNVHGSNHTRKRQALKATRRAKTSSGTRWV